MLNEYRLKWMSRWLGWSVPGLLLAGIGAANAADADQPTATAAGQADTAAAARLYHLVNLGSGQITSIPAINARDQLAFSTHAEGEARAFFFDGAAVRDIGDLSGDLGGGMAQAEDVNDAGQVTGFSTVNAGENERAFVWSAATGMRDLGAIGGAVYSQGRSINRYGQVAGYSQFIGPLMDFAHAFRWSAGAGLEDLGTLAGQGSHAEAINDGGMVVGSSGDAGGKAHGFAWTRAAGMLDIGTLAGLDAYPTLVNGAGQVAGYSAVSTDYNYHGFAWTRYGGMRDIGTLGGAVSGVWAMNEDGKIAGVADTADGDQHGVVWTRAGGLRDLGTFGGPGSNALDINASGHVVGGAMTRHGRWRAFLWTGARAPGAGASGLVDLNRQLAHAPAGLVLDDAVAISANGVIAATSNAGLVLLRPGPGSNLAPVIGPVSVADTVPAKRPFALSASFADADESDRHSARWSWGDGSAEQAATVSERQGAGSASGSHVYRAAGVYWVRLTVRDSSGKSSSVSHQVAVSEPGSCTVAGNGWFISPRGALKEASYQSSLATFRFESTAWPGAPKRAGQTRLQFSAGKLSFQSDQDGQDGQSGQVALAGARGQYQGSGKVNGVPGFFYALSLTDGAGNGESDRFGLRIWQTDARTGQQRVVYDNAAGAANMVGARGGEGSLIGGGRIVVRQSGQ